MINIEKIKNLYAPADVVEVRDYDSDNYAVTALQTRDPTELSNSFTLLNKYTGKISIFNPLFHSDKFNKSKVVYKS